MEKRYIPSLKELENQIRTVFENLGYQQSEFVPDIFEFPSEVDFNLSNFHYTQTFLKRVNDNLRRITLTQFEHGGWIMAGYGHGKRTYSGIHSPYQATLRNDVDLLMYLKHMTEVCERDLAQIEIEGLQQETLQRMESELKDIDQFIINLTKSNKLNQPEKSD